MLVSGRVTSMERAQLPRQQEIRIGSNQFVHLVTEVLLYIMSWKEETFLFLWRTFHVSWKKSSFKSSSVPFTKCFPFAFVSVPYFFWCLLFLHWSSGFQAEVGSLHSRPKAALCHEPLDARLLRLAVQEAASWVGFTWQCFGFNILLMVQKSQTTVVLKPFK